MKWIIPVLSVLFMINESSAQKYDALVNLKGFNTKVYYSEGNNERAESTAARIDKVINFYSALIPFKPAVTLLILNKQDWSKFTSFPVYGMPHYDETRNLLIIASENNEFWESFIPPVENLPEELAIKIKNAYSDKNGNLTMQPFFDLLAIHELGHAYHFQAGINMQRKWMGELFCNIMLHTYIAENEPEQLPALTVFPQMVISSGTEGYKFTSLSDIEERYEEIGSKYPKNYGWYQCRWHSAAGNIYDAGGVNAFINLWNALSDQKVILNNSDLAALLASKVHQEAANVMSKWDEQNP